MSERSLLYLTTTDTDLLSLDAALEEIKTVRGMRVVARNLTGWDASLGMAEIGHLLANTSVVVMRLLGGRKAAPEVFDEVVTYCKTHAIPCIAWSADGDPHAELDEATTVDRKISQQGAQYAALGGAQNFSNFLLWIGHEIFGWGPSPSPPAFEPWTGIYWPSWPTSLTLEQWRQEVARWEGAPVVLILFYRAHWLSHNLQFIDALVDGLIEAGAKPLPVFAQTLKDEAVRQFLWDRGQVVPDVAIVTMSFSVSRPSQRYWNEEHEGEQRGEAGLLADLNVPVIQAMVSLGSREEWEASGLGLGPVETAMNIALPEFDGRIISVPFSFRGPLADASSGIGHDVRTRRYQPVADRVEAISKLAVSWAKLASIAANQRRLAIVLTNYPSRNSRLGNAVGLDTPQSVLKVIKALHQAGFDCGSPSEWPSDGNDLMQQLIDAGTHDANYLSAAQMRSMNGILAEDYTHRFEAIPEKSSQLMKERWGEPPGTAYYDGERLVVAGVRWGNLFVGIQPPRQVDDDEIETYHSPELPPTHHYVAYYHWLRQNFGAHAIIHMGKHGTLEWLPGKGIGLSQECFPDLVLGDLPNFYPFVVDDPGEGTQAKRRSHAVVVDHMVPPVMAAGLYDHLVQLQQLLDQYYQVQTLDPDKLPYVQQQIWELVETIRLTEDLSQDEYPVDFDRFTQKIDGYLCELESAQIRDGLHILGEPPSDREAWGEILYAMLRIGTGGRPSFGQALASDFGIDWEILQEDLGRPWKAPWPDHLGVEPEGQPVYGDIRHAIEIRGKSLLGAMAVGDTVPNTSATQAGALIDWAQDHLVPRLQQTPQEIDNLVRGLNGEFVPPGPSGAPTRGMVDVLPTGRNFYSVDPRGLPSWPAWQVGQKLASALVEKFFRDEQRFPDEVGIVVWGTAAMRTGGDDIAEVLALLGVRPRWRQESNRIDGLEVISLEELGRPRVDVTVRISGFFRDAFANLIDLVDEAVHMVAQLDEPLMLNPIRRHVLESEMLLAAQGVDRRTAKERSIFRIFGAKPGTYGSGILPVLHTGQWQGREDLAAVYTEWSGFSYGRSGHGIPAREEFIERMKTVEVATKNQDNREHDIFDSDDYLQDHGGMVATIQTLTGKNPHMVFGDSSDPSHAKVRSFDEEARRVYRTRVVNPRWIASAMRHGYKGALEMANTVDFLFGYDATADLLEDWMYEGVTNAYALDPAVQEFFHQTNPWALKDITERLLEAAGRGLWAAPREETLRQLQETLLEVEEQMEGGSSHR